MSFIEMYYFYVFVVVMITPISYARFAEDLKSQDAALTDTIMFDIGCKCFSNEEHMTLAGIWKSEVLQQMQHLCHPLLISLVGINKSDMRLWDNRPRLSLHKLDNYTEVLKPHPSNIFLINEVELSQLNAVLPKLKCSIWWNQYGNFVVKITKYRNNCIYASSYLKVFWNFEILKVLFLCEDSNHTMQYYTFNPFSRSIPIGWVQTEHFYQKNNHPFRIFKLQNNSLSVICEALKFDKSLSLNGYPIKLAARRSPTLIYDDKLSKFQGPEASAHQLFWSILEASLSVSRTRSSNVGLLYPNGTATGTIRDVLTGKYDSFMDIQFDDKLWKNQIYIYEQTALCFATKKKLSTINQRVSELITWKVTMFIFPFYLLLTVTFMKLSKDTFFASFFDVLRALLGASTLRHPVSPRYRINFMLVILGIMLITLFLNSVLCSLVIAPDYEPFLETRKDLVDKNYTLYAPSYLANSVNDMNLSDRTHYDNIGLGTCIQAVEKKVDSACLHFCNVMSYKVTENNQIHISEFKEYHKTYYTVLHRDNLSFRKRWINITRACQEGGFINFHINLWRLMYRKRNNGSAVITSITQQQMSVTYLFWLYGLIFSCFILILEYFMKFMKQKFLPKISDALAKL